MAVRRGRLHYLFIVTSLLISITLAREGQIRLAGPGSTRCSGRVEVYHSSSWGTVCDDGWDLSDAQVVCRQLDCGTALMATSRAEFGPGSGQIWLEAVGCFGSEGSLTECQHNGYGARHCDHSEDAGVVCSRGQIRLAGHGSTLCSGRVEVYHNSSWGTVCDADWDLSDAQVVCRQMNCGVALMATQGAEFGPGSGQIWLDDVGCSGSESSLTECKHRGLGTHNCGHNEDAGVVCSMTFPKPGIAVTPSKEVKWGQTGVSVTCSITTELSGGTFTLRNYNRDVQHLNSTHATFDLHRVTFDSGGPYHCVYQKYISGRSFTSPQSDSVTIKVNVVLPQPTICVSSPDRGQQCSSDTVHVTRGHSFVISCSVHSDVPEGLFVLIFSGSNSTVSEAAVNHSASFHFPVSQDEHQGNYSCVYQVTGPGHTYTSVTAPVQIIIKLPLLLVVAPLVAGGLLLLGLVFLLLWLLFKKRSRDDRSETNVQAQMSVAAGNQNLEDSYEGEADYVNVDEPKYTDTKHNSNQPMRSNSLLAPRSRPADSQDRADKVRFVKVSEACFVENREDEDFSDEGDYENVDDYENDDDFKNEDEFENDEEDYENDEDDEEDYENVTDQL